jgi:repressor LexA
MHTELTPAQNKVMDFIRGFMTANDYAPTRAEIATALGYRSANAAEDHLKALQRKGWVRLIPHIGRGIRLVPMPTEQMSLIPGMQTRPVLGLKR